MANLSYITKVLCKVCAGGGNAHIINYLIKTLNSIKFYEQFFVHDNFIYGVKIAFFLFVRDFNVIYDYFVIIPYVFFNIH
jgi:hypothetical protein